ncbi:hypothetical protein SHM_19950 [Spiroplasma ixodetis]|uniref:Transposase n=1 Tax=Spiroplasma ixodetis TaxID=2141 RepID=A0ABN6T241_9MOLU|nr:hypothetical protein [Spiroplasma ixodetis]BDT02879.1 hypothetical protein SHM_05250 [Spiroplasma ixodetis]BDT04349.1 hypothetical protein SHM_19950 [Spiroplasma ixodetis]
MTRKSELQMAKKDNFNNNDPISKAVDLLLENTEDLTTVFKPGGLYKELTKRLVEKMLNSEMQNYLGYEKINIVLLKMLVMVQVQKINNSTR